MNHAHHAASPAVTIWSRPWAQVVGWIDTVRRAHGRRRLDDHLAQILETAGGHQSKGLPAGAPAYVALYDRAGRAIDAFCAHHGVDRLSVEQDVPALRELEHLTHAPAPLAGPTKAVSLLLGGALGAILLGSVGGLIAVGYHWMVHALIG